MKKRVYVEGSCFLLLFVFLCILWLQAFPQFRGGLLSYPDTDGLEHFTMPLEYQEHTGETPLQLSVFFHAVHFTHLRFIPDDCVRVLEVNTQAMQIPSDYGCDYITGFTLDVSQQVQPGKNMFVVWLQNNGGPGGLRILPAMSDPLHYVFLAAIVCLLIGFCYRLQTLGFWKGDVSTPLLYIVLAAVVLRFVYLIGTPYTIRAYDVMGHIDYANFLLEHKRLPVLGEGWLWYQPPLYYVCLSLIIWVFAVLHMAVANAYIALQLLSFLVSILTLAVAVLLGKTLLQKSSKDYLVYTALIASSPALVYFSARVNNDVFLLLFSVLGVYFLVLWWQKAQSWQWYSAVLTVCLALLTKSNGVVLFGLAATLLVLHTQISWCQKWSLAWRSVLLLCLLVGWLVVFRLLVHDNAGMVGNADSLDTSLSLQNSVPHLLSFNPIEVLEHPFVNPWEDAERRQYFVEYVYRTAFFGEFMPPVFIRPLAVALLMLHMLTIPLFLWSFFYRLRYAWQQDAPILLVTIYICTAHLLFRWLYPFSSSQDFRYSTLLVIPVAYFSVVNLQKCPKRIRQFYSTLLYTLCILYTLFVLGILFSENLHLF